MNVRREFGARATSHYANPRAVDVIRAKRRELVYGISNTQDLLDLLVAEGVMTPAKRSVVLTITAHKDQNSRVLDFLEAKGERACRKFFHPCLKLVEPELYRRLKGHVEGLNEQTPGLPATSEGKTTSTNRREVSKSKATSESLIHKIAADGKVELLEEMLNGANVNAVDSSNDTPLHVAAEFGRLSVTELLLREGAGLELRDDLGLTAMHRAASRGHTHTVQALVKAGAPINALDPQGKTPLQLAAENKHLECVKALVQEEEDGQPAGQTLLHAAAKEGNWRLAELLLQGGATANARDQRQRSALFYAVARSDEKTVTVLLSAGAKVDDDIVNEAIKLNQESILRLLLDKTTGALSQEALTSALFSTVRHNQERMAAALIDSGADVNTSDIRGYTPLLLSAELGHTEVFRMLVAKQAKLDATLPDLSSALHLAIHSDSVPILQTLLEFRQDPNSRGPKAQTPLHLAAQWNRPYLVGLLLSASAQVNALAEGGVTALHLACRRGHADTVMQLLQGKADPQVKDKLGRTALHWAASSRAESHVVDLLLSAKANPNSSDTEKKTPLHLAAIEGKAAAVASLLFHKAKAAAKDMNGCTPLHYAAEGGNASLVSTLLQSLNNKGVAARNAWRKTPLHVAAEKGHSRVALLLLEAGGKVNATDHSNDTPLHCAARGGHTQTVRVLLSWAQARETVNLQATNKLGKMPVHVAESGNTPEHQRITTLLKRKMLLIK